MRDNERAVVEIKSELGFLEGISSESEGWRKKSIYKIPACVTDLKPKAYKPQMVSIGPYHHGEENLQAMEEHKSRALGRFLNRSNKTLSSLSEHLAPAVQDLKDAYDRLDPKWEDNGAFLEVMIVDGCFIWELLRTTTDQTSNTDYASNDPIFSSHGTLYNVPYLQRDMLMLENQIPMPVLEELDSVQNEVQRNRADLTKRILQFFSRIVTEDTPQKFVKNLKETNEKSFHILDVYRRSLLLDGPKTKNRSKNCWPCKGNSNHDEIIRSATELKEAGIKIKKSKTKSLKDISFQGGVCCGVLKLPLMVVDDAFEPIYRNLMAYERFHVGAGNEVTSYIFFMDSIIDSVQDVSHLHSCGVIQNALGSDKAVATLFNSLSTENTLEWKSELVQVHQQVSAYSRKQCPRWRAYLMQNYCANPLVCFSVAAAFFLFALTIIQTVCTVLSYVRPPP